MPTHHPSRIGTKLGPRLAMLVVQGMVYAHSRLASLKHKLAMAVFHAISDEISEEVDVTLGPMLQKLHDLTPTDHDAYPAIHFMHTATGQLKALAGTGLQISGLLGSISVIMNNELAPVVYEYVKANPHILPDPSVAAQMAASGLIDESLANDVGASQGINAGWMHNMIMLTKSWPDLATGIEFLRRKLISRDQFALYMGLNGVDESVVGLMENLVGSPLSPADLALAVLRGNMDAATGATQAYESGVSPEQFNTLLLNTGEPPGLQQLLEGYRRGFIDQATLQKGIKESRYRNEWIPLLEALRYEPMSVADAVNATVQNQLPATVARKYADQNGLQPGDFDILLNTAGEPLSRTEMEHLYNRGLVTKDQVVQALRESRLKNKYNELAFDLHSKILPETTIQRALRYGGISTADAIRIAMENGYSKADATILVSAGTGERLQVFKDRVVSSVITLYEDNLVSSADTSSVIEAMGFSADQASFVVKGAEFRREAHILNQVVNAVKSKYVQHHITAREASNLIDAVGVPSTQRDYLLNLWEIEASAYVRTLTEAQVVKAVKKELITMDDGVARLEAMGYRQDDAILLIEGA